MFHTLIACVAVLWARLASAIRGIVGRCPIISYRAIWPEHINLRLRAHVALLALTFVNMSLAQTNDSLFPTSTIEDHGLDAINLQNLTVLLHVPLRSKVGATPFEYDLVGSSSCVHLSAGGQSWVDCGILPNKFHANSADASFGTYISGLGYNATASETNVLCPDGVTWTFKYTNWIISDPSGGSHPVNTSAYIDKGGTNKTSCYASSASAYTTDGSGLYLTVANVSGTDYVNITITAPDGATLSVPQGEWSGFVNSGKTYTDSHNNTMSATAWNTSPVTFTDTLATNPITQTGTLSYNAYFTWQDISDPNPVQTSLVYSSLAARDIGCATHWSGTRTFTTGVSYPDGSSLGLGYQANGRITSITLRTGGQITYTYSGGTNGLDCLYLVPPLMTRTTQDGTTTYTWTLVNNGNGHYGNTTTVVDPGGNKTVYTFTGLTSTGYAAYPVTPVLTQVQKYRNIGTVSSPVYSLLSTDVICYNGNSTNCTIAVVSLPLSQKDVYHTINGMATSAHSRTLYDTTYGNVTGTVVWDFGASNYTYQTSISYGTWNGSGCATISTWIKNKPCDVKTIDSSSPANTLSEDRYTYDASGNLTSKATWTGSIWLTASFTPNPNGTVAQSTDVNETQTTYTYAATGSGGCNGLLLTQAQTVVPNSTTLTTSKTWGCNGAVPLTLSDANGHPTTYTYNDPFFRLTSVTDPLGYTKYIAYTNPNITDAHDSLTGNHTLAYSDGLGRLLRSQKQQSSSSSNYDSVSHSYGWNGIAFQTGISMPCAQTQGADCSSYFTYSLIDSLGRVISTQDAAGRSVASTYLQNDVNATLGPAPSGENTKSIQTEYDGLGRPKSTCQLLASGGSSCGQNSAASGHLTSYAYSTISGGSKKTAMRGVQTRTFQYDAIGRLISQNNPEAGAVTNVYDIESSCGPNGAYSSNGDLLKRTDARGITNCYYYDALHRVTDIGNSSQSTTNPCKRFRYDNSTGVLGTIPAGIMPANTMGKMVEAATDTCASPISQATIITDEWFSYDKAGRRTDVWELSPHSGGYYHTSVTYYPNGVVSSLNGIPGYAAYNYGVDGEGRSSSASQGTTAIISNTTFNAASQPLNVGISTLGDNDTYTYDPATGRMQTYTFTVNGMSDTGTLTWNNNGTLKQLAIVDGFNSGGTQTCTFGHDDLARLVSDNCGTLWSQTFSYDQYDNVTKSGSITWAPGYNAANNRYSSIGATYDLDGNLTYDSFNSYTWDAFGEMSSVRPGTSPATCGTSGTCVTYDANGRPVEKNVAGAYSEILYSPMGKTAIMSGASTVTQSYIPLPGGLSLIATGTGGTGTRRIEHRDWLGTGRLSTTLSNRTVVYDRAFAPYGEMYANFGTTSYLDFTGDRQDLLGGLFDTPNRELPPTQGRWLSPDPAGAGWNLYAYVSNDPLTHTDPSGLQTRRRIFNKAFGVCGNGCIHDWNSWDEFDLMQIPVVTLSYTPPFPISVPITPIRNENGEAVSATIFAPGGWSYTVVGNGFDLWSNIQNPGTLFVGMATGAGGRAFQAAFDRTFSATSNLTKLFTEAGNTVPDLYIEDLGVMEIKAGEYVYMTPQLEAQFAAAQAEEAPWYLVVSPETEVAQTVIDNVALTGGEVAVFDAETGALTALGGGEVSVELLEFLALLGAL